MSYYVPPTSFHSIAQLLPKTEILTIDDPLETLRVLLKRLSP